MAYATGWGHCANCGKLFGFNPVRVPSIRVNGTREPVCLDCLIRENRKRVRRGLPPLHIPAPDAYDAVDEGELR